MSKHEEGPAYAAIYAESFNEALLMLPDSVYERVEHTIGLLEEFPKLGHPYRPEYEASPPPVDCMQMFVDKTRCALYYMIEEKTRELIFFYLGDTRQNPLTLFGDIAF